MSWFSKQAPAVKISEDAQLNVVGYLQKYYGEIEGIKDPSTTKVAEEIRQAFTKLLIDINRTQPAILILKKMRKVFELNVENLIKSGQVGDVGSDLAHKAHIEDLLGQLGVTNFDV